MNRNDMEDMEYYDMKWRKGSTIISISSLAIIAAFLIIYIVASLIK